MAARVGGTPRATPLAAVLENARLATLILGAFAGSPLDAVAVARTGRGARLALESSWPALLVAWSARWGAPALMPATGAAERSPSASASRRTSARLASAQYYSPRLEFSRFVQTGVRHAFAVHNELYEAAGKRRFTARELRRALQDWAPAWCDAGAGVKGATLLVDVVLSKAVPRDAALACVQLLVEERGSDLHARTADGVRVLGAAAARGMDRVVEYLVRRCGCAARCLAAETTGQFVASDGRVVRGTHAPRAWAQVMRERARLAGVPARALARLDRCASALRRAERAAGVVGATDATAESPSTPLER